MTSPAGATPAEVPPRPSVTVVIPSVRGGDELVDLVHGLLGPGDPVEVVIADNGLSPDICAQLGSAGARLVSMGANLGFGAAVNRAAHEARGEVLAVLNDDITPEPGFLDALVAPIAAGADMVAGVLLQERAPDRIETAGVVLDRTLVGADHLQGLPLSRLRDAPPPFGPTGGAAAYRLSAFRAVGGFDAEIFAYLEDVDLAIRLREHGAVCALARDARALHAGSGTLGYASLAKANLVGFSRGYVMRKYRVLSRPGRAAAALLGEIVAVLLLARRHRSLGPGIARVRGWRRCSQRATPPPEADLTVGLREAWRRRWARAHLAEADRP